MGPELVPMGLSRGQRLRQPDLKLGLPLIQRAIKEIVLCIHTAFFVRSQVIDIAVFEHAAGERDLFCSFTDQQCALHELASIVTGENTFLSEVKRDTLKAFIIKDTLFRGSAKCHAVGLKSLLKPLFFDARPPGATNRPHGPITQTGDRKLRRQRPGIFARVGKRPGLRP